MKMFDNAMGNLTKIYRKSLPLLKTTLVRDSVFRRLDEIGVDTKHLYITSSSVGISSGNCCWSLSASAKLRRFLSNKPNQESPVVENVTLIQKQDLEEAVDDLPAGKQDFYKKM